MPNLDSWFEYTDNIQDIEASFTRMIKRLYKEFISDDDDVNIFDDDNEQKSKRGFFEE